LKQIPSLGGFHHLSAWRNTKAPVDGNKLFQNAILVIPFLHLGHASKDNSHETVTEQQ